MLDRILVESNKAEHALHSQLQENLEEYLSTWLLLDYSLNVALLWQEVDALQQHQLSQRYVIQLDCVQICELVVALQIGVVLLNNDLSIVIVGHRK
jgi:hypothetical protein